MQKYKIPISSTRRTVNFINYMADIFKAVRGVGTLRSPCHARPDTAGCFEVWNTGKNVMMKNTPYNILGCMEAQK